MARARSVARNVALADVIADSVNTATGDRLTTFCLAYPRLPVHEHVLTHRMLSRNTSSNRAVSTARLAEQPIFVPDDWRLDDRPVRQEHALADDASPAPGASGSPRRSARRTGRGGWPNWASTGRARIG
jgi:hypothetical protein